MVLVSPALRTGCVANIASSLAGKAACHQQKQLASGVAKASSLQKLDSKSLGIHALISGHIPKVIANGTCVLCSVPEEPVQLAGTHCSASYMQLQYSHGSVMYRKNQNSAVAAAAPPVIQLCEFTWLMQSWR